MVFENIETLKREFTDKFVVVDVNRPELRRFGGQTGQVKTVNMNGRALVEFDGFANIGWYDIALDYLTVVDTPLPKEPENKATPKKAPAATEKQAAKPAAKVTSPQKEPAAGKMSVADMLAAARAEKSGGAATTSATQATSKPSAPAAESKAATTTKDPRKMSVTEMLASARAEKSGGAAAASAPQTAPKPSAPAEESKAAPTTKDPRKMSVAEMLAAARAEKSGGDAPAAAAETAAVEEEVQAAEPDTAVPESAEAPAPVGDLPTETADILAWCRQHDGG